MCIFMYFKLKLFKVSRCQNMFLLLSQVLPCYKVFPFHLSSIFMKSITHVCPPLFTYNPFFSSLHSVFCTENSTDHALTKGHQWLPRTKVPQLPQHLLFCPLNKLLMSLSSRNPLFAVPHPLSTLLSFPLAPKLFFPTSLLPISTVRKSLEISFC